MINVALIGNWGTAAEILTLLLSDSYFNVQFVVTQYDDRTLDDKWLNIVWNLAKNNNIPLYNQQDFKKNSTVFMKLIDQHNVDLVLSSAYPYLLKKDLIDFMNDRMGIINFHAGMLPKYRGVSPVIWAIINNEPYFGMTAHYIDEGCDSGDIIFQSKVVKNPNDTLGKITDELKVEAVKMFRKMIIYLKEGKPLPRKAQDHSLASNAPKIRELHLEHNSNASIEVLKNSFRTLHKNNEIG